MFTSQAISGNYSLLPHPPPFKKGLLNAEDRPHVSLVANPYGLVFGGFYDKPTQYKLHGAQDTPEKAKQVENTSCMKQLLVSMAIVVVNTRCWSLLAALYDMRQSPCTMTIIADRCRQARTKKVLLNPRTPHGGIYLTFVYNLSLCRE